MDVIKVAIDFFLHLDKHLQEIVTQYGVWSYAILFGIIFLETGVVILPFLPGDSLLFAAGAFAATGAFRIELLAPLLIVAAVLGDAVNYYIGHKFGDKILAGGGNRLIRKEYIDKTHSFFEKYGGKTIIIARFVPIVRTFAPFLAGMGSMTYSKFALYNVTGAILWVVVCCGAGYFFGNLPFVQNNFSLVVLAIIVISILPALYEFWQHRREKSATNSPKE